MNRAHDLEVAGSERLDELEPLWKSLHDHHAALAPAYAKPRPFAESWARQRARYLDLFEADEAFLVLARVDGRSVGYALTSFAPGLSIWETTDRLAVIETLSIVPEHRGWGLGSRLLEGVRSEAEVRHGAELWASVLATNTDAVRFYERHSFVRFSVEYRRS